MVNKQKKIALWNLPFLLTTYKTRDPRATITGEKKMKQKRVKKKRNNDVNNDHYVCFGLSTLHRDSKHSSLKPIAFSWEIDLG